MTPAFHLTLAMFHSERARALLRTAPVLPLPRPPRLPSDTAELLTLAVGLDLPKVTGEHTEADTVRPGRR